MNSTEVVPKGASNHNVRKAAKKAAMPRDAMRDKQFIKDWQALAAGGKQDMARAKEVLMLIVANDGPLPPEFVDHELKGEFKGIRECHIKGDLLLMYQVSDEPKGVGTVNFVRIGTHATLFG